jgi:uncharacterized membrane protein YhaH (DUF805 family)
MEWMILPLKRYAQFTGRSTRREFWMWVLFIIIVTIVLSILDGMLGLGGHNSYGSTNLSGPGATGYSYGAATRGGWLTNLFSLAVLVPNIAVSVRRLHDVNRSGWWILMPFAPYVVGFILMLGLHSFAVGGLLIGVGAIGAIVLLVWYCLRGTVGPNRFGPDPLADMSDLSETFR